MQSIKIRDSKISRDQDTDLKVAIEVKTIKFMKKDNS